MAMDNGDSDQGVRVGDGAAAGAIQQHPQPACMVPNLQVPSEFSVRLSGIKER